MKLLVIPAQAGIQRTFPLPYCRSSSFSFSWIPDQRRNAAVRNDGAYGVSHEKN
jgi:hypothetical protein